MTLVPLHKIRALAFDPAAEAGKIVASGGRDRVTVGSEALSQVYKVYRDMKTLGFFRLVAVRYRNTEATRDMSLRVYDIFDADTGEGRIFFIVENTQEALNAFLDDGFVLLKIREWLIASYRRVCQTAQSDDPMAYWNGVFNGEGSPLPRDVRVVPFYNPALAPGIPAVVLVLVYQKIDRLFSL